MSDASPINANGKTEPIPNMSREGQLELQNLLLKRDLFELQIMRLDERMRTAASDKQRASVELQKINLQFQTWKKEFETSVLEKLNLKFEQVDIDAETGKITLSNQVKTTILPETK